MYWQGRGWQGRDVAALSIRDLSMGNRGKALARRPAKGTRKGARKPPTPKVSETSALKRSRRGTGVRIAPSLLAANFANLSEAIRPLRSLSLNWLHLDIMDGVFVPNISFGADVVRQIRQLDESLFFDVHLMITEPRRYVKDFLEAGAQGITFHVEAAGDDSGPLLRYIRRHRAHSGISIKPRTKVSEIRDHLPFADLVLVMTVEPGFGGQKLIPATLNKVRELVHLREELGLEYMIQVDGGIDPATAPLAVAAGADVLVAGTSVFGGGKLRHNTRLLRQSLSKVS